MYEVELKVPADHERVRARLESRDATTLGRVEQVDTYYSHPGRDFGETDEALRLRRERPVSATSTADGSDAVLTYKGPRVSTTAKTRTEVETEVADGEAAEGILDALGFEPFETVRKRRERYELEVYTVALDDVEGLGTYVEVERHVPGADVDAATDGAEAVLRSLDLDPADAIGTSYLGLQLDPTRNNSS